MRIFKYITSLLLLFGMSDLMAQTELPKRKRDWVPSTLDLSGDVVGLINMASSGDVQSEFSSRLDFDQFFLAFDFGFIDKELKENNFTYSSDGSFYRIGPQVNFMPYNKSKSSLFVGLMYASSTFSDHIDYFVPGDQWPDVELEYSNENIKAHWFEVNLGLSAKIVGPLYFGYVIRFKMAKSLSGTGELFPYEIPGFGDASKDSNFGFNYYITYRLGFRNKPVPERPKKAKRLEKTKVPESGNE